MRKIILAISCGLFLVSCASQETKTAISNDVAGAVVALTAAENLALIYTRLPRCPAVKICSDPAIVDRIKSLDNQAYSAVKAAEKNQALLSVAISAIGNLRAAVPAIN